MFFQMVAVFWKLYSVLFAVVFSEVYQEDIHDTVTCEVNADVLIWTLAPMCLESYWQTCVKVALMNWILNKEKSQV